MPTLKKAIIEAFQILGGVRSTKEIKTWINQQYPNQWKDITTSMADMVHPSHGGNPSSQVPLEYRVLKRVSRGMYCLLENELNKYKKVDHVRRMKNLHKPTVKNQTLSYLIKGPDKDNLIEVYATQRLPFEPKGKLLELRNQIRNRLVMLQGGDEAYLYAIYKSLDQGFFDVENVLFYNVGPASFNHLKINTLQFERVYEEVNRDSYEHYQSYRILSHDWKESFYWTKDTLLAKWDNVIIPRLRNEMKPHLIWYAMKKGPISIENISGGTHYGMEISICAPVGTKINLISIIKPLLDGIISAFHYHDGFELDKVVERLLKMIPLSKNEITYFLLDKKASPLGIRNLVQPYGENIKWNPEDDAFSYFKIKFQATNATGQWNLKGEMFTLKKLRQ